MKRLLWIPVLTLLLSACGAQGKGAGPGMGMGMGGNGMMARHHAEIPAEYAGRANPIPADQASLERGAALYATNCASCHGDGGMGDGPAGAALNPAPAPIAQTSQAMGDDYLFWRLSEGGTPFNTSMPPWQILDEEARWDLVNYMRALGAGTAQAGPQAGRLTQAVDQGLITEAEANTFSLVHNALEAYLAAHPEMLRNGQDTTGREAAVLAALVAEQRITQAQAEAFQEIHNRLGASGLMP